MEKKYCTIGITETLSRTVFAELKDGENYDDAMRRVEEAYRNCDIILYPDDYVGTDFEIWDENLCALDDIKRIHGDNVEIHCDFVATDKG